MGIVYISERELSRDTHGPGVERGNLPVEFITDNIPLRTESLWNNLDGFSSYSECVKSLDIFVRILTNTCDNLRIFPEKRQVIGDISGRSPVLATQCRREKRHIETVERFRENLALKGSNRTDNGIEGHGSGDKYGHT